ncbi:MAG: biotin/lipoyl-containing protein, partial [Thermaurantiacus tibetensis]
MATDVRIPALGESVTEASVGQWLKQVGDRVAADEPIVSLETDKVAVEVPAPVAGVLVEQLAKVGETVEVGALIARIAEAEGAAKAADAAEAAPPAPGPDAAPAAAPAPAEADAPAAPAEPRLAPAAERLIAQYALDPASISGSGKGGQVTKADVLAAIEAVPLPRPIAFQLTLMHELQPALFQHGVAGALTAAWLGDEGL